MFVYVIRFDDLINFSMFTHPPAMGGERYCDLSRCPSGCPVPSAFLSICTNSELRISVKICGDGITIYHQHQINWLHFGRNCTSDKVTREQDIGQKIRIDVKNRCCHVVEWLYSHAPAKASYDRARSWLSVKYLRYMFIVWPANNARWHW